MSYQSVYDEERGLSKPDAATATATISENSSTSTDKKPPSSVITAFLVLGSVVLTSFAAGRAASVAVTATASSVGTARHYDWCRPMLASAYGECGTDIGDCLTAEAGVDGEGDFDSCLEGATDLCVEGAAGLPYVC